MSEATTISALATAPAPSGIAVVRVSGPKSRSALRAVFRSRKDPVERPRELVFGEIIDFSSGQSIDKALAVFMPAPHSYTGEDVAEFQFHGSLLLVDKLLRSLFAFGAAPAEPGEFTTRAFLNGKIDLVQAEAIADLIQATSEQALIVASDQLKGRFSDAIDRLGEPLRNLVAEIEASLDFSDEDIEPQSLEHMSTVIQAARAKISALIESYHFGQIVKEGFRVLLCGRPNAGKSSLLNLLLGRPRAIVSEVPGTTRDLIEEQAVLSGYKFVLCDSAGIAPSEDKVEKIGIELAREKVGWADLVLLVVDATDSTDSWKAVARELQGKAKKIWMITNKIDKNPTAFSQFFCDSSVCTQNFYLSALTRDGYAQLVAALVEEVKAHAGDSAAASQILSNARQRDCLERADVALARTLEHFRGNVSLEIISADVRDALAALEDLVGRTYTEDILGRIFSKFCIGK